MLLAQNFTGPLHKISQDRTVHPVVGGVTNFINDVNKAAYGKFVPSFWIKFEQVMGY